MAINGSGTINGRANINGSGAVNGRGLLNGRPLEVVASGNALLTSLTAYYKLEAASGQRDDETANGLHLTDNNTVTQAVGKIDNAAAFASVNTEYLSRADSAPLDFSANFSLSIWVYTNTMGAARQIASKWTYATQGGWSIRLDASTPAKVEIFIAASLTDGGDNSALTSSGHLAEDTWHHLVMVYNGAGAANADRLKLYVDGSAVALGFTGTIPASLVNNSADLQLGRWPGIGDVNVWNGRQDEAGLWGKSLSSTDVTTLYGAGSGFPYASFD